MHSGDLIAAGRFLTAGGTAANSLARWNGSSWTALGGSLGSDTSSSRAISDLSVLPNGELVASGQFTLIGGTPAARIALWNGTSWLPLGSTINGAVNALAALPHGALLAAGQFLHAGRVPAARIALWNGIDWSPLGSGLNNSVNAVASLPGGDIVAAGAFTSAGDTPANRIAVWNGTAWSPLGSGMNNSVNTIVRLSNGDLVAAGSFTTAGNVPARRIALWNGSDWAPLQSGFDSVVNALTLLPSGELVAAGSFTTAGENLASRIARWDGSQWLPLGAGMNGVVHTLAVDHTGNLFAGGTFTTAGGVLVNNIAKWDGASWLPLGTGITHNLAQPRVSAIAFMPNGDLIAGGNFTTAGGVAASRIARWNGSSWNPVGSGIQPLQSWTSSDPFVSALALLDGGELAVGGSLFSVGGHISAYIARHSFTNIPAIAIQPSPQSVEAGNVITLTAAPTNGYGSVSLQWLRNGVPIMDGPGGASPGGGIVSGAHATLDSPTKRTLAALTIVNSMPSDSGYYTVVFSNPCGSTTSIPADVLVVPPCPADFNRDGGIDGADIAAFFDAWETGDLSADVNLDHMLDNSDIDAFFLAWEAGGCD